MKFFETLLSGLKAIILSHSYSKTDSDAKYLAKDKQAQSDWKTTNSKDPSFIKNKPALIGKEGTGEGAEIFNKYNGNNASGDYSHAEGYYTAALGRYSHAEGDNTTASAYAAHAEGMGSTASREGSHAEGSYTRASQSSAHAEGYSTTASGNSSHAEGSGTTASGRASHAEGEQTTANTKSQHVQGEYNILDTEGSATTRGKYAHIVGNGTSNTKRSNAHTLDWSGNAWFAGEIYVGGTSQDNGEKLAKMSDIPTVNLDGYATESYVDSAIANITIDVDSELSDISENPVQNKVIKTELNNYLTKKEMYIPLIDSENGFTYFVSIKNGQLVSEGKIISIEATSLPITTTCNEGDVLNIEGLEVMATFEDGSTGKIFNNDWNNIIVSESTINLSYNQLGTVFTVSFEINVITVESRLIDFEYTKNDDGTYTLTAWKGTLNGEPSTELVVPDSNLIQI